MSKALALSAIIRAFLGDADAGVTIVSEALSAAVVTMAVHGTRAPVDDAVKLVTDLKGKTTREKAMRAGLDEVRAILKRVAVGKTSDADAASLAEEVARLFVAGAGEILTAPKVTYAKPAASDVASRALKALAGLTDPQIAAMVKTAAGAELLQRVARIAAVQASVEALRAGADAAKTARVKAADAISKASQSPATT